MAQFKIFELEIVPLHSYTEYIEKCVEILNQHWPRSKALRYRSLTSSCDELPTSLVLRGIENGIYNVMGHARLNKLPNNKDSIWIDSVVIRHDIRGRGYGRVLMEEIEKYALSLGYNHCVLSTHDKQSFYLKLGYTFCPPVNLYGGIINRNILPKVFTLHQENSHELNNNISNNLKEKISHTSSIALAPNSPSIPPPPPPPPAEIKRPLNKTDICRMDGTKQFMCKNLTETSQ